MKRFLMVALVVGVAAFAGSAKAPAQASHVIAPAMTVGPARAGSDLHTVQRVKITTATERTEAMVRLLMVGGGAGLLFMGYTGPQTKNYDRDAPYASQQLLDSYNRLQFDNWYQARNHSGTVAPGAATGTGNLKPKTTNNTTYYRGGSPRALAATDNFWDLTTAAQGVGVVPISSFIKYRLIVTAGEAQKVQSSTIGVAANGADCSFGGGAMADGDTIIAQCMVATDGAHTFTPGTTQLGAAGITTTYTDGSDGSEFQSTQLTR